MSLDRSLKTGSGLAKHRNVLTRAERIAKLADKDRFDMNSGDPIGLPKVASRKAVVAGKTKKKPGETDEATE